MVDEADIDLVGGGSAQSGGRGIKRPAESPNPTPPRPSKRKAGPLSKDISIRRPFSSLSSPPSSPFPSTTSSHPTVQPVLPFVDVLTRPDSPLPYHNAATSYASSVESTECEEEPGPLLIDENVSDMQRESNALPVNGRDVITTTDKTSDQHASISNSVPALPSEAENHSVSLDTSCLAPSLVHRLANGDIKGGC